MLDQYHVAWRGTRPLARLREAHHVMRTFLDQGAIDFEGDFYRYKGLFTAARPVQERLPLKIGAMRGPGSFRLAGEIADGVHVACAHSDEALGFAAEMVREGAARVDRTLTVDFDFCASVLGAIAWTVRPRARAPGRCRLSNSSMPPSTSSATAPVRGHGLTTSGVWKTRRVPSVRKQVHVALRRFGVDLVRYRPERRIEIMRDLGVGLVLDVGANTGQFASRIRASGYRGAIMSFEPLAEAYASLKARADADPNWTAFNFALGDRDDEVSFNVASNSYSSSLLTMGEPHHDAARDVRMIGTETVRIQETRR